MFSKEDYKPIVTTFFLFFTTSIPQMHCMWQEKELCLLQSKSWKLFIEVKKKNFYQQTYEKFGSETIPLENTEKKPYKQIRREEHVLTKHKFNHYFKSLQCLFEIQMRHACILHDRLWPYDSLENREETILIVSLLWNSTNGKDINNHLWNQRAVLKILLNFDVLCPSAVDTGF